MAFALCTRLQSLYKTRILLKYKLDPIAHNTCIRQWSFQAKNAPLLKPPRINIGPTRTLFFKIFAKPTPEMLRQADGIPEYYKLIYRNTMHRYLLAAQVFSSISALIVCFITLLNCMEDFSVDREEWRSADQPRPVENENLVYVACFITLCVILQLMISRLPIRIYSLLEKEKYIFVFYGSLPATKRRLMCTVKDVAKVEESGLLPWKDSRYEIRNKQRIIMLENFFRRPADLNIMLGYQKAPKDYD